MQGYNDPPELRGVIPHSFDHIFENIKGSVNTAFLVRCCYLEVGQSHETSRDSSYSGTSGRFASLTSDHKATALGAVAGAVGSIVLSMDSRTIQPRNICQRNGQSKRHRTDTLASGPFVGQIL